MAKKSAVDVLAANMRRIMRARGMSEAAVAKAAGIDKKTVNNVLNRRFAAQLDKLDAIAKALDIRPWRLLLEDADPQNGDDSKLAHLIEDFERSDETGKHGILTIADIAVKAHPNKR
jgi:transcriptional regulator with XRE-family HTH domain